MFCTAQHVLDSATPKLESVLYDAEGILIGGKQVMLGVYRNSDKSATRKVIGQPGRLE